LSVEPLSLVRQFSFFCSKFFLPCLKIVLDKQAEYERYVTLMMNVTLAMADFSADLKQASSAEDIYVQE